MAHKSAQYKSMPVVRARSKNHKTNTKLKCRNLIIKKSKKLRLKIETNEVQSQIHFTTMITYCPAPDKKCMEPEDNNVLTS